MEIKAKKREWVKNVAIILLAVLLVLTFFSNTIMNRNLPEVATQYVSDGTINAKVRGTGTVQANGTHVVKAEQTREIRAVMVKSGQTVEAGDVLFVLGSGERSELEQAQEQLYQLQMSYQRAALGGSSTDYTADEIRVQNALEAYQKADDAVKAMDPGGNTDSEGYQYLQRELEKATAERDAAKEAYDALMEEARSALSSAESERLAAEQAVYLAEGWNANETDPEQIAYQQRYLDDPQARIDELTNSMSEENPDPELERKLEKWTELLEKKNAVSDAETALNAVSTAAVDAAQSKVDGIQAEMNQFNTSPEIEQAVAERDGAYLNYIELQSALDA